MPQTTLVVDEAFLVIGTKAVPMIRLTLAAERFQENRNRIHEKIYFKKILQIRLIFYLIVWRLLLNGLLPVEVSSAEFAFCKLFVCKIQQINSLLLLQSNSDKRNSEGGEKSVSFIHSFFYQLSCYNSIEH